MKCFYCENKAKRTSQKWLCSRCVNVILSMRSKDPEEEKVLARARERLLRFAPEDEDFVLLFQAREKYKVYAEAEYDNKTMED